MENNILYSNNFLDIKMINPNYPYLEMKRNGAVTVPYDEDGNIYLLYKKREIGYFYEVPRGFVESSEDYMSGAVRELLEETGMSHIKVDFLGSVQADTGIMNNKVQIYALQVNMNKKSFNHFDEADNEKNKVVRVSKDEIRDLIIQNRIVCGYTLSALSLFWAYNLV